MSDTKSNEAPQPQPSKTEWWRAAIPLAVLLILWFCPLPDGLSAKGMHMFAIFAATIVSILTAPLPTGAIMFIALTVAYFTGTLTLKEDLAGFSSGTVWLIFSAYILSLGFVKSGLGKRIAYFMLSKFGGSSTGIAYSLGLADLIMASAMPSVTARGGGIIMPVARSICRVMGSEPGESGKKIGDYLMMTCFQVTPITGGLFMTGMAANLLAVQLAKDQLGIQLTWGGWTLAAFAPCVAAFLILPWFTKLLIRPTMNHTPEVKVHGKEMLAELGPLSTQEKKVAVGFILALLGWGTAILTGFNANAIGIAVVAYLMVTKALEWKDALAEKAAWDTVVWFGVFISLATGLSKLGFIKWFTGVVSAQLAGSAWIAAVAIACGAPVGLVAIAFCIFSNPMWGLTEYGSGPGPLYFGQGYFERPRFYALNFAVITMDVVVMLAVGIAWWKVIGLY